MKVRLPSVEIVASNKSPEDVPAGVLMVSEVTLEFPETAVEDVSNAGAATTGAGNNNATMKRAEASTTENPPEEHVVPRPVLLSM